VAIRVGWRAGTTARTIAATVGTVAAWAAVTALGTWGTFPGSGLAEAGTAGEVSLGVDGAAGAPLEFSGLVPGGAVTQAVTLVNGGDAELSAIVLSTLVVETSLLDSDPTDGLQLRVDSCSVAWTPEWTCAGERQLSVAPGPVVRRAELRDSATRAAAGTDHLAVTVTLPATAGSQFQGLRSELILTFTGVRRSGDR
jgi:hypothetical protein